VATGPSASAGWLQQVPMVVCLRGSTNRGEVDVRERVCVFVFLFGL